MAGLSTEKFMTTDSDRDAVTEKWRYVLMEGDEDKPASYLPGNPRCAMCEIPMGGIGGFMVKILRGKVASRKNPYMCNT